MIIIITNTKKINNIIIYGIERLLIKIHQMILIDFKNKINLEFSLNISLLNSEIKGIIFLDR